MGNGVDIISLTKMHDFVTSNADSLHKYFTENEINYCHQFKEGLHHLAARFAAKEAVLKALGIGMLDINSLTEIEIYHDVGGRPNVNTSGKVKEWCRVKQVNTILISLSHCTDYAVAHALAISQ